MPTRLKIILLCGALAVAAAILSSCGTNETSANTHPVAAQGAPVAVVKIETRTLERKLTQSSELVPFQEIDVYAKESGFVKKLNVDYGSRVKTGDVMAVLEIPELEAQIAQDDAAVNTAQDMITHAEHELTSREKVATVLHLEYTRLDQVAKSKPGLVAQQEVDDAQGKDLSSEAQVEAAKSTLAGAQSQLEQARAKRLHDQTLFDYARITAPFEGVVTQRYANFGTLMQAGTSSSTAALPLVRLSQDDKFRLVIPVPETFVPDVHIGDAVDVDVPALNKKFAGRVARFSVDVREETRTMHTEVDVENPQRILYPGLYANATLTTQKKANATAVPLQAVDRSGDNTTVDIVTAGNKIEIRRVTLGIETASYAEVLSGLDVGDTVVVGDRSSLNEGQAVTPKTVDILQYSSPAEPQK